MALTSHAGHPNPETDQSSAVNDPREHDRLNINHKIVDPAQPVIPSVARQAVPNTAERDGTISYQQIDEKIESKHQGKQMADFINNIGQFLS